MSRQAPTGFKSRRRELGTLHSTVSSEHSALRWLTIVAPACFLVLLELVRALLIEPRFGIPLATLMGAPIVLVGILTFSVLVFRRLDVQERQIIDQNRRLAAVEERERIGRELQDGVIQAIYGAGLALDDALHSMSSDPAGGQEKVRRVMGALDRTIGEIRAFITGLATRDLTAERAGLAGGLPRHDVSR